MARLKEKLKPRAGAMRTMPDSDDATVVEAVRREVTSFLLGGEVPGAESGEALCKFWQKRQKTAMIHGVRVILCCPAGNAVVERFFGDCRSSSTAQRRNQNPSMPRNCLRHNGPALGLDSLEGLGNIVLECDGDDDSEAEL